METNHPIHSTQLNQPKSPSSTHPIPLTNIKHPDTTAIHIRHILSPSNTIKRLCLSVCLFVCMSHSLLSCIKSVWKAGGIVRTVSARAFYIPSFKKFYARVHAISCNFHAILAISAIFGPISTCWVSKCMYLS